VWRNRHLCRAINPQLSEEPRPGCSGGILWHIWPATWRSGLGVAMSYGLVQATGLIQAQIASTAETASYLLCLRLLQMVSAFSQAPFYSKLALFARLRSEGKLDMLLELAGRAMRQSLWAYTLAYAAAGLLGPVLMRKIGSSIPFPDTLFWVILGGTFFIERYAAMHLNLYNTTNDIITHVANGVTGLLCIAAAATLVSRFELLALPVGLLVGYLAFYAWYPVVLSYRKFKMPFPRFELQTSVGPMLCFVATTGTLLHYR
jgi:hypothetical protein